MALVAAAFTATVLRALALWSGWTLPAWSSAKPEEEN
jgi:hypothetical protein